MHNKRVERKVQKQDIQAKTSMDEKTRWNMGKTRTNVPNIPSTEHRKAILETRMDREDNEKRMGKEAGKMQVNKKTYEKKYRRCVTETPTERIKKLINQNKEHLRRVEKEEEREIIEIEIKCLKEELESRGKGEQKRLGE